MFACTTPPMLHVYKINLSIAIKQTLRLFEQKKNGIYKEAKFPAHKPDQLLHLLLPRHGELPRPLSNLLPQLLNLGGIAAIAEFLQENL